MEISSNNRPKVLHFPNDFTLDEIYNVLENRKDIIYFTRFMDNQLHVIKYSDSGFFNIQKLIESLLKHYENDNDLNILLKGIKIKGNNNFSIINNISDKLIEKIKYDLNNLLIK